MLDNITFDELTSCAAQFSKDLREFYAVDRRRNQLTRSLLNESADIIDKLLKEQEERFRVLDATKVLKRQTFRDADGNAHLRTSNEVGWLDPVTRLALLEDIVEEARR
ncbi:MAG: hypothetical protein J6Q14_08235 [Oscillospiraceae bacterium]|nr:hypothetical protein [Oscillospiraceae bacterium]